MEVVFSKTPEYGMVSGRKRNLSSRRISVVFLTPSMNEFGQKRFKTACSRAKVFCFRTNLGFLRATQVIKPNELIPCEKDPVLSSRTSSIRGSPKRLIPGDAPRCKDTRLPRDCTSDLPAWFVQITERTPCLSASPNISNLIERHVRRWRRRGFELCRLTSSSNVSR